jgi:PAS domain S-box-containing protein
MGRAHRERRRAALRLTLLLSGLLAAVADAAAERLPIKAYTTDHGLAHNRVKRIVQDSQGFLWFCTAAGLSRFDGYQFTSYGFDDGLPPSLNDLVETSHGVYWIATNSDGVVRFDPRAAVDQATQGIRSRFTVYPISSEPVTNRVNVLHKDAAGMLWAGTDGGLFRLNERAAEKTFRPERLRIPSHPDIQVQVWALVEDSAGNLWIGTKFGLVRRLRDGRTIHYAIRPTGDDDNVAALAIDFKGSLWVGHRAGLFTFTPEPASFDDDSASVSQALPVGARRYTTADGLDNDTVLAVHQSADRRIWIRTFGPALTVFDGLTFRTYAVGERAGDNIARLTEDREGNLWFGTKALGALKVMRNGWTTYGEADGLGESVASMFENHAGELYVYGSRWLVSRYDGTGFTTVRLRLPKAVSDASWRDANGILQDHAGEWWIATRQGLVRFPRVARFEDLARVAPAAVYTTRDGLATNDVTRLFEDSHGDIWIGSWLPVREPVVRWERASRSFHRYSQADGLRPFVSANAFREDAAGGIWVGFREGGLVRYRDGRFTSIGPDNGLPAGGVNSLYLDQAGRLWAAASQGGLCRIEHPEADRPRVVTYSTTDGLASTFASHVTGDLAGRIYVSHTRGIDRLDAETMTIKHYSAAEGLPGSEFRGAFRDHSGALWFCTSTGLSRLDPEADQRTSPPPILISSVRIAGVARPLSGLGETAVSLPKLDANQNHIEIDFLGIDLRAGEVLRYQYKLEGATGDWSAPSAQRSVNYASLAPGAYRFLVRAVSADGTPSQSPATLSFQILPPLWRRWWFLATAAAVMASAVIAFTRSRYQRLKALRESENRFRTLAETASDAIITIDEESRILLVNQAAEKVFGYTRQEMTGAELTMLMPGHLRDRHEAGFSRYKQTGKRHMPWQGIELPGLHKDGHEIPLEISFGEFTRDGRRFFTGLARDITERKRAAEALRRTREERLLELERVRKRIATDLHDDVGSSLTRISLLSEVARQRAGDADVSLAEPLSSIAGLARELVDSMSDIVWAINPNKDQLSDLSQRMRHFASDVLTARQITLRFRTPALERDIALGANVRRELCLMFKEAVNNIARHAHCTHANLDLSADVDGLVLRVSDDGRGFEVAHADTGHGLASMRQRTEALGGQLHVISAPGYGTALTFVIPLAGDGRPISPHAPGVPGSGPA